MTETEEKKDTNPKWVANASGIAILLVILGHIGGWLQGVFRTDFHFVNGFNLVALFLISGYTIQKRPVNREYLNRCFSRWMVPFFSTCFAIILLDSLKHGIFENDWSTVSMTKIISDDLTRCFLASGSITNIGTIETGLTLKVIWLLPALFFAHVFFQLLLNKTENDRVLGFITASISFITILTARLVWFPFSIQSGLFAVFFFYIGYEVRKYEILEKIRWHHYGIALIVVSVGILFDYSNVPFATATANDVLISLISGLAGTILIYGVAKADSKGFVLEWIGKRSILILCALLISLDPLLPCCNALLDLIGLQGFVRPVILAVLVTAFSLGIPFVLEQLRKIATTAKRNRISQNPNNKEVNPKRDPTIDVCRGILIILMLVGHYTLDWNFRKIIYSFHMPAFIFLSGYCYHKRSVKETFVRLTKSLLLPYVLYAIAELLMNPSNWNLKAIGQHIVRYAAGMSYADKVLPNVGTIGVIWFLLMLFIVRLIYAIVDHMNMNEFGKTGIMMGMSVVGLALGAKGYWLPWSFDVALYAMVFYHAGVLCRQYDLLSKSKEYPVLYFVFASIWAYMIYVSTMEIAIRQYGNGLYGINILGSMAGIWIIYRLTVYLNEHRPFARKIFSVAGKSTIYILLIHSLLGSEVNRLMSGIIDPSTILHMISSILIQTAIGVILCWMIQIGKEKITALHVSGK